MNVPIQAEPVERAPIGQRDLSERQSVAPSAPQDWDIPCKQGFLWFKNKQNKEAQTHYPC